MIRRTWISLLAFSLLLLISFSILQAQEPDQISPDLLGKIDPRLMKKVMGSEDQQARIMILMREQADLSTARAQHDILARRRTMIDALKATAQQSQADILSLLAQASSRQAAKEVQSFWIVNRVAAVATWETVLALAARDEVSFVRLEETFTPPPFEGDEVAREKAIVEWGIAKIQAPQVWQAFGLNGTGIVVANMDSGVDYLHPDLRSRYRGYNGDRLPATHEGNWYDPSGGNTAYPVDFSGHGTHTMGTMVGDNGIGVAPGATWISVRLGTSFFLESTIHDGFQWLLAPAGNPALAPDVVNNSWGNPNGSNTVFQEDVQHLLEAGIIPIFSNGNNGPDYGTVGAPGSYDISFSVGAIDSDDEIANFSSRGPSSWGKIKPDLSAPGVEVLSTVPGGAHILASGTSMAAPHVSGAVALMLQAKPDLTYEQISDILKATAYPLGELPPNNEYGWGRLNAYAAVQMAINSGIINGIVTDQTTNQPIEGATITFAPRDGGQNSLATTDAAGTYIWAGSAGLYDVMASAFGYLPQTQTRIEVLPDSMRIQNFALPQTPRGTLQGRITDANTGTPLSATLTIDGTPIVATNDETTGNYAISLPEGSYTLTVKNPGYRVAITPHIVVQVNQETNQDVMLEAAPTILLVDSGAWYQYSRVQYYQTALDDSRYYYDTHRIKNLPDDVPSASQLAKYDVVIWSAPLDAPALIGANDALVNFMDAGGHLLLSGQDVAFFDGGASLFIAPYYYNNLKAVFDGERIAAETVTPVADEIFRGLEITIAGGDGANDQLTPDEIFIIDADFASTALTYDNGSGAGHRVGHCLDHRAINLGFGLEGVNNRATRAQVVDRSLAWFQAPPLVDAFAVTPPNDRKVGSFGGQVTHTLRLRNLAEVGPAETYTLNPGNHQWVTAFPSEPVTLGPCEATWLTFTVHIPANVAWNAQDILTITVQSIRAPEQKVTITRTSKAPATVLLVDDDRWYESEDQYIAAFATNGIQVDHWDVGSGDAEGSPPLHVLQHYPMVVWYTAYDWFDPLRPFEEVRLQAYLEGGGRVAFSSQEYLFKLPERKASDFAQTYFGVYTHSEVLSSTMTIGAGASPIGHHLGPYDFFFPDGYQNFTDTITPTETAQVTFLSQDGLANSLTHSGGIAETWHTAFFAFGPELLDETAMAEVLGRTVGWLSWLGNSTVAADVERATNNTLITYEALLKNDGVAAITTATFTATFPYPLNLVSGSATGGATAQNGVVIWQGALDKGQEIRLTYQAQVSNDAPYGIMGAQKSWLGYNDHNIIFNRVVAIPVNAPDWRTTRLEVEPSQVGLNELITFTLYLTNTGQADAPLVTVTTKIPPHLKVLTDTIIQHPDWSGSLDPRLGGQVTWAGAVPLNQTRAVAYTARLRQIPYPFRASATFEVDDGFRHDYRWSTSVAVKPYTTYLPLIFRVTEWIK